MDSHELTLHIDEGWREWESADPRQFQSALQEWRSAVAANGMTFEGMPYPAQPFPVFVTSQQHRQVRADLVALHRLLEKVLDIYEEEPGVRRQFFGDYERARPSFGPRPPYAPRIWVCRFDGAWDEDGEFRIVEANTACPGGVVQTGLLGRLWRSTGFADALPPGVALQPQPLTDDPLCFARSLLSCARSAGVTVANAAVVNLRGTYTNEVTHITRGLSRLGIPADVHDVTHLSHPSGIPTAAGRQYNLLYYKLDPLMLIAAPAAAAHLAALRRGAFCGVNPLIAQVIAEDKAVLALLTNPDWCGMFLPAERDLITRLVPWTRLLVPGNTALPDGSRGDLLAYTEKQREHLVLKPANSTRGDGVIHGALASADEWATALARSLQSRHVIQERVSHPSRDLPRLAGQAGYCGLDGYLLGGEFAGFHARACAEPTINIGRGGSVFPVLIADRPAAGRPSHECPDKTAVRTHRAEVKN
ncbi:MAG TPA: hypothetical protein VGS19_15045 [Streptosporangiaceae bacterium]|nr:hypothetical protein [Streptosporangiaceae bacterium]